MKNEKRNNFNRILLSYVVFLSSAWKNVGMILF